MGVTTPRIPKGNAPLTRYELALSLDYGGAAALRLHADFALTPVPIPGDLIGRLTLNLSLRGEIGAFRADLRPGPARDQSDSVTPLNTSSACQETCAADGNLVPGRGRSSRP